MKNEPVSLDGNPNSLELHPEPKNVSKLSKRAGLFVAVAVGFAIGVLIVNTQSPKNPPTESSQQQPVARDNKVLLEPQGAGLVTARDPQPQIGTPAPVSQDGAPQMRKPLDPVLRQELEQLRQYRIQQQLQALQSPLVALTGGNERQHPAAMPVRQQLSSAGSAAGATPGQERSMSNLPGSPNEYNPAAQQDKESFLNRRSNSDGQWRLENSRSAGQKFEIKAGSVLPGIMISGVNSDLPGVMIAQLSQNVYDTASGHYVLIPQGSRLFGKYDSRVIMGQERVLIAWNRLVLPDGSSIDLGSMPGADQAGYAGFTDEVNNHYMRIFGSSLVMSLITGGMAYSMDSMRPNNSSSNNNPSVQDEMASATASQMGQASMQLLQKHINVQPTLEIRPGYRFNLVVVKDIVLEAPYTPWR